MATAVAAGVGWEHATNMPRWELEGWTHALNVAKWEREGGAYDPETDHWEPPPTPSAPGV